jgi:hypothetical protein
MLPEAIQIVVFWVVTACTLVTETDVSEEHAISIFSVGVRRFQELYIKAGDKEGV